jgi:amidase
VRPVSADGLRLPRSAHHFTFSAAAEPLARVASGSSLVFETLDCFSNRVTSEQQRYASEAELVQLLGAYNPVTGPVYVDGAEPGDVLAVSILGIETGTAAPFAVTTSFGAGSRLVNHDCRGLPAGGSTRICALRNGVIEFPVAGRTLRLRARPMVGTIGTAPAGQDVPSVQYARSIGGNMDCPMIQAGAVVYQPVWETGGLLFVGDVHALMGDAEITGTALETSADVSVRIRLMRRSEHPLSTPHVDCRQEIGVVGCSEGADLETNLEIAMVELQDRLCGEYGMAPVDAYELLGAVAKVNVNQCVPQLWKSVYAGIDRRFLPHPGRRRRGGPAVEGGYAAA